MRLCLLFQIQKSIDGQFVLDHHQPIVSNLRSFSPMIIVMYLYAEHMPIQFMAVNNSFHWQGVRSHVSKTIIISNSSVCSIDCVSQTQKCTFQNQFV